MQKFSHLYKKFWKKVELQRRKFWTKCFQFFYKCFPCPFLLFRAVKNLVLARTLLLRRVVHARLSLYIIHLSRDVRSLVILYSSSQPHIRQLRHTVHCILLTLLVILVVSCSPYSSYPAHLTRHILFASLVISCSLDSSYLVRLIRHIYVIASLAVTLVSMKFVGAYVFIDFLVV